MPVRKRTGAGRGIALGALLLIAPVQAQEAVGEQVSPAAETFSAPPSPDTTLLHHYYMDGNFEPAISQLETALDEGRLPTRPDTLFAFRHLGVMYAAKYETREKGKAWLRRLLEADTAADLRDMRPTGMIRMIFKDLRDELAASRRAAALPPSAAARPDSAAPAKAGPPASAPLQAAPVAKARRPSRLRWIGATAGVLAVGGVATYIALRDPEPKIKTHKP